ncbi:MAG: DUF1003 domain-containing protein, partial [Candidatus Rokuibacteriota bacterium]
STAFALLHAAWFAAWIIANAGLIPGVPTFDPFPFSFLTLVVSLEAIFLTIFVLISQSRMTRQADHRAHLDLQINLLAEQEATATLRLLRQLCGHLGFDAGGEREESELAETTDVRGVASEIKERLPSEGSE